MRRYMYALGLSWKHYSTIAFLPALVVALCLGIAPPAPAHAAPLQQTSGKISGSVTVAGMSAAGAAGGVTVELRRRNNSGVEDSLATTTTDDKGNYGFVNQPSAPSDAFYYVKFSGGKGTLAAWYTFPIIYLTGSDFTVPTVELADVALVEPVPNAVLAHAGTLKWKARKSGETYRLFIYRDGKSDKPIVDSGSLGTSAEFTVLEGLLPEGKYEGIVQVRDAVVGYGQSQSRFRFTISKAAGVSGPQPGSSTEQQPSVPAPNPTSAPQNVATVIPAEPAAPEAPANPTNPTNPQPNSAATATADQPQPPEAATAPPEAEAHAGTPNLTVHLSADKSAVDPGTPLLYTIEVSNKGDATASEVVVTDQLPVGVTVAASGATSTHGAVVVSGNTVTVQVGELAPDATARVQIPVQVAGSAANNLSNQASAVYRDAPEAVQSNAYISQVSEPASGPPPQQAPTEQPAQPSEATPQPTVGQPQQPTPQPANEQAEPTAGTPPTAAPVNPPPAAQPQPPTAGPSQGPAGGKTNKPESTKPKQAQAPMPQTGGSFPLVFATLLLLLTLLARYLRGVRIRRT